MDKWFVNMVAGAVLSALLVIFGASTFIDILYPRGGVPEPAHEGAAEMAAHGNGGAAVEQEPAVPFPVLLAKAEAAQGEKQARKCAACHTFDEGGANKIGPNLHGVVGRSVASHEGFAYSAALQDFGGEWTYEKLNCFIHDPKGCVQGNKMSFAGVKDDEDRADVIAYLRSISPDAPPLPEPPKAADASDAVEGEGAASEAAADAASSENGQDSAAANTETEAEAQQGAASSEPATSETGDDTAAGEAEETEAAEAGDDAAAENAGKAEAAASAASSASTVPAQN